MASNSLHEHGLIDSDVLCAIWDINSAMGIIQYSTGTQSVRLQSLRCMWMLS